jgi:hypothetical protein
MADTGKIRGYSIRKQAEFLRTDHIDAAARERAVATLPEHLRGDLGRVDPAGWYPRDDSAALLRAIASTAPDEPSARKLVATCGEQIASESTNTFLKLVMKLMTPVRFANKLPDFWKRDMQGGFFVPDVSRASENRIGFVLDDVEGFDHIGPCTEGWLRFAMKALGKTGVEVDLEGWSLAHPGPKAVRYEVRWA